MKLRLLISLALGAASGAQAFSLLGTNKTWQVSALGYDRAGDIGAPMEPTEGYRWNITNVFYAMDSSFLKYFGTRGMEEVDKAFAVLNALPNASAMSQDLFEFPQTDMLRQNYRASALGLLDVKSTTLEMMMEQMGLAEPVRWTFGLRSRNTVTFGGVTITNYVTRTFNFDPVDWAPSRYVNGALYGWDIFDPIAPDNYADAIEVPLDSVPFANGNPTPVASFSAGVGRFWMGLTRDDVGGLRFLLRTNNYNTERILAGSEVAITNTTPGSQVLVTNQDLRTFLQRTTHTTNDPVTLLSYYPDLIFASTNADYAVVLQTNLYWVTTNAPNSPTGHVQMVVTNFTTNIVTRYDYTFENVVSNVANGSFYLIPPAYLDFLVITNLMTNVVPVTNFVFNPTNFYQLNTNTQFILTNYDLALFAARTFRTTNDPATVLSFYPSLIITNTNTFLDLITATNIVRLFTNAPFGPTNFAITNIATNVITRYQYQFSNLFTNVLPYVPGIFHFSPPDILNLPSFAHRLTHPTNGSGPVSEFLTNQFAPTTLTLLSTYDTNAPSPPLTNALVGELNEVVTGPNIYTPARFAGVNLRGSTQSLLDENPQDPRLGNLNRLLLEDAYPEELRKLGTTNVFILPTNIVGYQLISNLFFQTITNAVTNLVPGHGSFIDYNSPIALGSSNLALFLAQSRTNSATNLMILYPGLVVTNTAYTIGVQTFTNYFYYLTNPPFAPAGSLVPAFYPVVTNVLATNYTHWFANVVTNTYFPNAPIYLQREEVYRSPFAPAGTLILKTNYVTTFHGTGPDGSFYIVPTNLVGYQLIATLLTNTVVLTNYLQPFFSTNFAGTNVTGTNLLATNVVFTNTYLISFGQDYIFSAYPVLPDPGTNFITIFTNINTAVYGIESLTNGTNAGLVISDFTNVTSSAFPIEFQSATNSVFIRPGVDKVNFYNVTRNYDSLIGQFFTPITNRYVERVITNSELRTQVVRRVLGQPDILFLAEDLGLVNNLIPALFRRTGTGNWENNDAINGQANQGGPGVIRPPIRLSFTDQLPYYVNQTPFFLDETTATGGFVWGAYDGTTNTPTVFPERVSIQQIENEVLNPPVVPP